MYYVIQYDDNTKFIKIDIITLYLIDLIFEILGGFTKAEKRVYVCVMERKAHRNC